MKQCEVAENGGWWRTGDVDNDLDNHDPDDNQGSRAANSVERLPGGFVVLAYDAPIGFWLADGISIGVVFMVMLLLFPMFAFCGVT